MTDFSNLIVPDNGQRAHDIHLIDKAGLDDWLKSRPEITRSHVAAVRFKAKPHEVAIFPDEKGSGWSVLLGVADVKMLKVWCLAKAAESLGAGHYRIVGDVDIGQAMVGWALGQYRFLDYRKAEDRPEGPRILVTPHVARIDAQIAEAEATAQVRDMVNIPAEEMGPAALEARAKKLAETYQARLTVTQGDALETGYPMIHAVGRAASRAHAPRLIELKWGKADHPKIAIVGKGVTFDTGGLSMKSSAGMLLMKKDMGGAAHALALASLVMEAKLPVHLHLLIPAVENAIDGSALRPGDILNSRKGLTVEITNTDAEGRLVLGDALTLAGEEEPELIIDFATLTGAARVALGPDLPAMFANKDDIAEGLIAAANKVHDPVWRLPLWPGYEEFLSSDIADSGNSGGSFAGAVTAALFLQKFIGEDIGWAHFDTYAWRPTAKPGQTKGGEALGLRAAWHYLQARYQR
jgi:leucyl aminopeptidase